MKLTMLVENEKGKNHSKLKAEHGLCIFVEFQNKKILFDCGASGLFIENAITMGIDIKDIDFVILSHAHVDHAGGLSKFLEQNHKAKVFMSIHSKEKYFIRILGIPINISIPLEIFNKFSDRITFVDDFKEVFDGVFIITNITDHLYSLVKSSKRLLVKKNKTYIEDYFLHEIILAIKYNNKLEIFTGCSHNGIDNMIEVSRQYFPNVPIHSVIGGFHLMGVPLKKKLGESKENIISLGNRIMGMNIEKVYTCHCTGMKAFSILRDIMSDRIEYFNTGMQIEI